MQKAPIIVYLSFVILLSACSQGRYGYLARVKTKSHRTIVKSFQEEKFQEPQSIEKIIALSDSVSFVPNEKNNPPQSIASNPKKGIGRVINSNRIFQVQTKVFKSKLMGDFPKPIPQKSMPDNNSTAHTSFVMGVIALIVILALLVSNPSGFAIILSVFLAGIISFIGLVLGLFALNKLDGTASLSRFYAWFGIGTGILIVGGIALVLWLGSL